MEDDNQEPYPSYTDDDRERAAYFADVEEAPEGYDGYAKLCTGIIEGCLAALATPPPPSTPPDTPQAYARWVRSWQRWVASRRREIHFASGRNFYVICEAAGLNADVFLEYLQGRDLLEDPGHPMDYIVPPVNKEAS